jgi:serine/threonine-protein kinase RsbW
MSTEGSAPDKENGLIRLLDLRMAAEAKAIAATTDSISATLTELEVPEEKRFEIALAVQEALANAVVHGCDNDPSKEVRCRLERDRTGAIVITVRDPGPGFGSNGIADPMQSENLFRGSGRGVYLIRQLMDEVQFENGGNQLRMWKY